jgi:CheY-like chemotaxis protein
MPQNGIEPKVTNTTVKRRVLIVDDERVIVITTRAILDSHGYETEIAYDGREAIEVARTFRPEFLLTDVNMPNSNGVDAAIEIKKFLPECRVLLLSGHVGTGDLVKDAREHGMDFDFLAKPVHASELLSRIREIMVQDARPRILVVDDNPIMRYATVKLLAQSGYEMLEAADGFQAIRMAAGRPSLVLLDINMPGLNGFEVLQQLKADELTRDVPVIHLTAFDLTAADRERSIALGATDCLIRPIHADELLAKLDSALHMSSRRPAQRAG